MSEPFEGKDLDPRVRVLLGEIANYAVVIGSVARRARCPQDLDLLINERAEKHIRTIIRKHGIEFSSAVMGSWTFCEGGYCGHVQVELLPVHRGPDYRTTRRRSTAVTVLGLNLRVARPEDAG